MQMDRRTFVRMVGVSGAVLAAGSRAVTGGERRLREGFTALRGGAGLFAGRGGTIGWLVGPDVTVVVDTQFPDTAADCLQGIQQRAGRTAVDVVVNTHHHGDHTGGNRVFAPVSDQVVGHWNVPGLQRAAAERSGSAEAPVVPTTVFRSEWRMDFGSEAVSAVHLGPAHTGGDIVVAFERADVVHVGDLVFNRRPPFIDRAGGASIAGWIGVLEQVHGRFTNDTVFVFGHAGEGYPVTGGRADLLAMRDYLAALLEFARKQREGGKSEEEAAAAEQVPGFEAWSVPGRPQAVQACIRAAYQELGG